MLFWLKFFVILLILVLLLFSFTVTNLLSVILTSEFVIILIFFVLLFQSAIFNLNWLFGFNFVVVILGGLEIALSFLLLNL